ncbi:MAG TPA: sigma-70 family RNA polymerase sigma factor [Acidimicrobiales bacterium]|nr:sigma-70 family RNA polymerase sigma factor [Acidimicrobiales bacterium]
MPEPTEVRRFQELVRPELAGLYSLAARLTADDPEDLVQECLLHAYRSRESLREPHAAGRWLRAILLNAWKDRLRKRGRSPQEVAFEEVEEFSLYRKIAEDDPFPYSDSLHLDFLSAFGEDDVRAVLLRLPMHYRAPLVLRYMEGFATKEIARMLETPLGTVLARLHRGRKLFEKQMWDYAVERGLLATEGAR